jgi:transposase
LAQYFPELDRSFARSGSVGLEIVKWCLAPSVIAGLDYEQFAHLVAPGRRNGGQHKSIEAVWKMAVDSIGCDAGEAMAFEAKVLVEALEQIREVLRATDTRIEDICLQFPEYRYLLTIPGFGPDVSSKTLAAIGNPFRFTTGAQVLKMAGLDLSANRSGKRSDAATPVLSKKGKADLRYALYQGAFIASTRDKHFIAYYTKILRGREQEKGITTKMRVKLAAKLLVIAWTLMKKKESFSADYLSRE